MGFGFLMMECGCVGLPTIRGPRSDHAVLEAGGEVQVIGGSRYPGTYRSGSANRTIPTVVLARHRSHIDHPWELRCWVSGWDRQHGLDHEQHDDQDSAHVILSWR